MVKVDGIRVSKGKKRKMVGTYCIAIQRRRDVTDDGLVIYVNQYRNGEVIAYHWLEL